MKKKIGILGGSFNPIHKDHIELALLALKEAELDEILVIPTFITNLKNNSEMASSNDRLAMCKLASSKYENFKVSDIEIKRGTTTYTSDTLKELDKDNDYYLIMGADSYLNIDKWHESQYVLMNAKIIVAPRDDISFDEIENKSKELNSKPPIVLSQAIGDLSSSKIRSMIKNNEDVSDYLDKDVLEYIKENNLYRG